MLPAGTSRAYRAHRCRTMRRNSTPNQGSSGRRPSHGGYNGGSKGEMANIWEVVLALANALQDARNKLVSLMHTSTSGPLRTLSPLRSPLRLSGGQRCMNDNECCYSRTGTPSRAAVRNLHRAHRHGHVAFGASSEYPVTPRRSREVYARTSAQQASPPAPAGRRCTHPLHSIGLPARRVHPIWRSGVMKGCMKSHDDDQPASTTVNRACVNFGAGKDQAGSSARSRHDSSPDPPRRQHHSCLAKQFAALLSHEAHQQRERRLAEEMLRDKRPSWSRF